MSKYCGENNLELIFQAVSEFKTNCLINSKSLFTGEKIWLPEHFEDLITNYVENLNDEQGDFLLKLEKQLENSSPQAKTLVAEMLWFMFLCPTQNMGVASKLKTIETVLSWGIPLSTGDERRYLSTEVLSGIGNPGMAFSTYRWRELVYCIHFSKAFCELPQDEKERLLDDYKEFAMWLENIPETNSRQLRHMILFLFFPDFHERIFSGTNRKEILTAFTEITNKEYDRMKIREVDAEFLKLRRKLEEKYETDKLDYYREPLYLEWKNIVSSMVASKYMVPELNQILYGPPGTGKTYATINKALEILDPEFLEKNGGNREELKARFGALRAANKIDFVTFHQSFSYEDFVEGLKATTNENNQIEYVVEDGVFKLMCDAARPKDDVSKSSRTVDVSGRTIWKMSLGNTAGNDASIYQYCIENNCILLGYGEYIDFSSASNFEGIANLYKELGFESSSGVNLVQQFKNIMKQGDLIIVSDGNRKFRAIGEITGDYTFDGPLIDSLGYAQKRQVIWHRVYAPSMPINELFKKNLVQLTLYRLYDSTVDIAKLQTLLSFSIGGKSVEKNGEKRNAGSSHAASDKRVFIIDEINRGNISSIFGELITLLEPTKRAGAKEALEVTLPYSKESFSVPSNLYIVGTMNTADKSLAQVDIALRRRFKFIEMMPDYSVLEFSVKLDNDASIEISTLLETINKRIEILYDREHTIGHSFFLPLKEEPTFEKLKSIFELDILPLLAEYFFDDWQRIGEVLGDSLKKNKNLQFIRRKYEDGEINDLMGLERVSPEVHAYHCNRIALDNPEAYIGIYAKN